MMFNNFKSTSFIFVIILILWGLVMVYNLLGLDTGGGLLERHEVTIKVVLLLVALCGCVLLFVQSLRDKFGSKLNKILLLLISVILFVLTIFSIWFIMALRNG